MPTTPCDCLLAVSGVPDQWSVVISGVTNVGCFTCGSANGTYVLSHGGVIPAPCVWSTPFGVCGFGPTVALTIFQNADGTSNLQVDFGGGGSFARYTVSNVVGALSGTYTLSKVSSTAQCNF